MAGRTSWVLVSLWTHCSENYADRVGLKVRQTDSRVTLQRNSNEMYSTFITIYSDLLRYLSVELLCCRRNKRRTKSRTVRPAALCATLVTTREM